ncbi:MAG: glycosyltransferase family 4 protein [Candidatus Shapirobacteria bacterium]|jgi:glycosyltransferase involved in cell wall biosynthesis
MRLLFVSHIHPPGVDGGSKIIWKLRDYFQNNGHQTLSLATNLYSTDDFVRSNPKANKFTQNNLFLLPTYRLHRRLPKPVFKIASFIKFLVSCFKFRPDFIVAGPLPTTIIFYAILIKFLTRAKLIFIPCFHEKDSEFTSLFIIKALRQVDLLCTLTHHEVSVLTRNYHLKSNNCFVLGAGIDHSFLISKFTKPKKQNLLFLGNFAAHKQAELLIKSFAILLAKYPHLTLTLAGQKTLYYPKILATLKKLPLSIRQKIKIYPKRYSTSALAHFLSNCSFLVLPSIHESFGLVFIEALARGRAVIGADIGPVSELIAQTGGGLTFKPKSIPSLTKAISKLLSSPVLSQKMAQTGYQYIKDHYTWDKIGDRLCQKIAC